MSRCSTKRCDRSGHEGCWPTARSTVTSSGTCSAGSSSRPVRLKIATAPPFKPGQIDPLHEVLERFDYLQGELLVRLERGAGLALDRQPVVSPFNARLRYNLYSAFCVLTAHQRRHLWQAERVRATVV